MSGEQSVVNGEADMERPAMNGEVGFEAGALRENIEMKGDVNVDGYVLEDTGVRKILTLSPLLAAAENVETVNIIVVWWGLRVVDSDDD